MPPRPALAPAKPDARFPHYWRYFYHGPFAMSMTIEEGPEGIFLTELKKVK